MKARRYPASNCLLALLVCLVVCHASATLYAQQSSMSAAMPEHRFTHILLDQFEGRTGVDSSELRWDGEAWHGGDTHRLWLKSEAFVHGATVSDGDHELLYDRPVSRFRYFDAQAGLRMDIDSDPTRAWFAVGVEGLAPYHFEFAPTLYLRNGGRVAGRIVSMEDLLLTQRWIVQPEAELNFYSQDDAPRAVGSGLSDLDAGIRLRYEITRKIAPYLGFAWNGRFGDAADFVRQSGQPVHQSSFVFGLFVWR